MSFPPVLGSSFNSISFRAVEHSSQPSAPVSSPLASYPHVGSCRCRYGSFPEVVIREYAGMAWANRVYLRIVRIMCLRDDVATTEGSNNLFEIDSAGTRRLSAVHHIPTLTVTWLIRPFPLLR